MGRIRDASESSGFGQSGKRALTAAYDGEADAAAYFAGFSVLYHAGLTGVEEGKVKSPYISPLTPAQRYAAYTAGQNDAAERAAPGEGRGAVRHGLRLRGGLYRERLLRRAFPGNNALL